ncbi:ribonuclease H-like domain-containing protein [Tanacetum coccineum]
MSADVARGQTVTVAGDDRRLHTRPPTGCGGCLGTEMSADVARGHGGDGGGDDRPPPYQAPTGCGGCLGNRAMGSRFQNSLQSNFDQTAKISKSVFISNFPDDCSSRDLWKVCSGYGTVVDVFIPNKRSKAGKRFAFVRFIKVLNFDRLIENLKTIWIGRFHLSANPARFERPKAPIPQKEMSAPSGIASGLKQPIAQHQGGPKGTNFAAILKPSLVLDDSCLVNRDLTNCVMGEVLQFSSINNLQVLLFNEGFHNTRIVYLGGLWVMIELNSSKSKLKFMEHVGVASWVSSSHHGEPSKVKEVSANPLNIYGLLDKRNNEARTTDSSTSIPYPPGFTPANDIPTCNQDSPDVASVRPTSKSARRNSSPCQSIGLSSRVMEDRNCLEFNCSEDSMKAKIQWAVEGDENSNFFHGIVNRKRVHLSVKGVMVDGEWVDEPNRVPRSLTADQISDLEKPVSSNEIRKAVWSCGKNKSPGPDGFTFEFFRKYWDSFGWARFVVRGMASVLVNGSPTSEFQFHWVLKHGILLAPLPFILVMESLSFVEYSRTVEAVYFTGVGVTGSLVNESAQPPFVVRSRKAPFKYLGVMVGGNMSKINAWDDMVGVDRKISWVKWTKVLTSKKYEGLGVSSFYALNRALLFRWVWQISSYDNSLWVSYQFSHRMVMPNSASGRIFVKARSIASVSRCPYSGEVWKLSSSKTFRIWLGFLPKENVATRWIKTIPIKVNVFAWKLHLDRLPTRSNLLKRGIQVQSSFMSRYVNVLHKIHPSFLFRDGAFSYFTSYMSMVEHLGILWLIGIFLGFNYSRLSESRVVEVSIAASGYYSNVDCGVATLVWFKHSGLPVSEYYHKLNSQWREFDILTKLLDCVCEARDELIDQKESHRGIPPTSAKSNKPQASMFVSRTNDNRINNGNGNWNNGSMNNESGNNGNKGNYNSLLCKNCGLKGHTIERCFEIIGYPLGFKRNPNLKHARNFNNNRNNNADTKGTFVGNNEIKTSAGTLSFTNEHVLKLMSLLNDKSGSTAHSSIAVNYHFAWIIDSRTNQHMTNNTKNMIHLIDISDLKLIVGYPNGTLAKITHIGNLRLNNNVVLFDVLVVPKYCDLKRLGYPANQVLKLLQTSLNLSNIDHNSPYEVCHKAKQTRDHFPISDHKSTCLGELIHLDVWGLYKVVSTEGFRDGKFYETVFPFKMSIDESVKEHTEVSTLNFFDHFEFELVSKTPSSPNDDEEGSHGRDGRMHQPVLGSITDQPGHDGDHSTTPIDEQNTSDGNVGTNQEVPSFQNNIPNITEEVGLEAVKNINWVNAMNEEMHILYEDKTWTMTDLPFDRKPIGSKWVFRIKCKSNGEVERYKARLVAKGFSQKESIDYEETFSPVVKMSTVICLINLAVQKDWKVYQMYVNNTFLYGDLNEEIYMLPPPGFFNTNESKICKL